MNALSEQTEYRSRLAAMPIELTAEGRAGMGRVLGRLDGGLGSDAWALMSEISKASKAQINRDRTMALQAELERRMPDLGWFHGEESSYQYKLIPLLLLRYQGQGGPIRIPIGKGQEGS